MKKAFSIFAVIVILCMGGAVYYKYKTEGLKKVELPKPVQPEIITKKDEGKLLLVSQLNSSNSNSLISPLSIAYALSMLRDGANNNTKIQIDEILNNYDLPKMVSIAKRVGIANSLFIKDDYKVNIKDEYINKLSSNYNAEIIYDSFKNTDAVNKWVSDKTFNMINKLIDEFDKDTVLVLMNALAVDLEWNSKFMCLYNREEEFTKTDGTKIKVSMMNDNEGDGLTYLENDNAKGIIKPYKKYDITTGEEATTESTNTIDFEYIAILPNTNVKDYIAKLNVNELNDLLSKKKESSSTVDIHLGLPKYSYDYELKLKESLINLGMTDAFDDEIADFSNIIKEESDEKVYVSDAIHKTHIELSETGTKAAAVTAFTLNRATSVEKEKEIIDIKFNKPFIYLIREKNTDVIWFAATVLEPNKWDNNSECKTRDF